MATTLNKNSLMQAVQCVAAMGRFLEEYLASDRASNAERESLGELVADLDGALDNLSTLYEEARHTSPDWPEAEALQSAFEGYMMVRKSG